MEPSGTVKGHSRPGFTAWRILCRSLIRSTKKAGSIKVKAEVQFPGTHAPTPAELEIESIPYEGAFCDGLDEGTTLTRQTAVSEPSRKAPALSDAEKAKMLQEVEAQQADFGLQK